jgi:hypothetical protein
MGKSVAYTNYNNTRNTQPTTPPLNLPSGNNKPMIKKSKGFLNQLQNTSSNSNLNSQVTDVLKNLK